VSDNIEKLLAENNRLLGKVLDRLDRLNDRADVIEERIRPVEELAREQSERSASVGAVDIPRSKGLPWR